MHEQATSESTNSSSTVAACAPAQTPLSASDTPLEKLYATRLPWGVIREKFSNASSLLAPAHFSSSLSVNVSDVPSDFANVDRKRPGEYLMHLLMLNFVNLSSKKLEQIVSGEKRDKRLKDCFQKNEDAQLDKLVMTMGSVAEQSLPSLTRALLIWHESQLLNLNYLKQQAQHSEFNGFTLTATTKITNKTKQLVNQAKM